MAEQDVLLVCDVGGTNTTLAVLKHVDGVFSILKSHRYASAKLGSLDEALEHFLRSIWSAGAPPGRFCVSAAGPVVDNVCDMTNVPWMIDGGHVAAQLGIPTFVINDFSAICYALPLLDSHETIGALELPHPGRRMPPGSGNLRAVVGAGTGLGTGFLTEDHGHFVAHPSEGGHIEFSPFDETTSEFREHVEAHRGPAQGWEQFLSGQGLANMFAFFRDAKRIREDDTVARIAEAGSAEVPQLVSEAAADHPGLAEIMRYFVEIYARYASAVATLLMPTAGLYLAGGIAIKNAKWFSEQDRFVRAFERNYNPRVERVLRDIPIRIIADYEISLYGAAHAALSLDIP